jgi:hypothetical protein
MTDRVDFVVNGQSLHLSRAEVERAMVGVTPDPIRSHAVLVKGVRYPIKQVFGAATGLDRLDFTSATARRHLAKLEFKPIREAK